MKNLLLSICIPTYNHADYLEILLNSVPDSYVDKIEICISNNASTDHTHEVVQRCCGRFSHLKYMRQPQHCGFDYNVQNSVALASGKYCWTIGSDDSLLPNALDKVFQILQKVRPGILIASVMLHDVHRCWTKKDYYLKKTIDEFSFNFGDNAKLSEYFNASQHVGAIGGFLSSNIIKTDLWRKSIIDIDFALGYSHVDKVLCIISEKTNKNELFLFLNECFIDATAGNDETSRGMHSNKHRMFLDYNAIPNLARKYFTDPEVQQACIHILRRQNYFTWLYRSMIVPECDEHELAVLYSIFPHWWIWFMRYFCYRRDGFVHRTLKKIRSFFFSNKGQM